VKVQPYIYKARVEKVVDGDTIEVTIDLGFLLTTRRRLRLLRVNTAEMHAHENEARAKAADAKSRMVELLTGKDILIKTEKSDSFGRFLAEVWLGEMNVNDWLLEQGLAQPFRG
jgi:micrococcal nuclease